MSGKGIGWGVLLALACGMAWAEADSSPPGTLDPSFDEDGRVTTDFFGGNDQANALATLNDGRIVAVGWAFNPGTGNDDFALVRYRKDGRLDTSFGDGGKVVTDFFGGQDQARAITVQPDGKLVVVGFAFNPVTRDDDFAVARYHADGRLDTRFGNGGKVLIDFNDNTDGAAAVALQPNGRIIVAGAAFHPSTAFDFAVARLHKDGRLDTSYNGDGKVTVDFSSGSDGVSEVHVLPGCRLVAVGNTFSTVSPSSGDYGAIRLDSEGTLDASYGMGGRVVVDFRDDRDEPFGSVLLPNDEVILVGRAFIPGNFWDFGLARLDEDGRLEEGFGDGGLTTTDFFRNHDQAFDIARQKDGRLVVVGNVHNSLTFNDDFGIARYDKHGRLDLGFGMGGRMVTDFEGGFDEALAVKLQKDGRIVVGGRAGTRSTGTDFALSRYFGGKSH